MDMGCFFFFAVRLSMCHSDGWLVAWGMYEFVLVLCSTL